MGKISRERIVTAFELGKRRMGEFKAKDPKAAGIIEGELSRDFYTGYRAEKLERPMMAYSILAVSPRSGDDMGVYGTSCGFVGNLCFGKAAVTAFLKLHNNVFGVATNGNERYDDMDREVLEHCIEEGGIRFSSAILKLSSMRAAYMFAKLVEKADGSLRPDNSEAEGHVWFESE
jgi:hypothetical protein